jgi:Fic family protein
MRFPKLPSDASSHWARLMANEGAALLAASPILPDGRYLHWDELRYRTPPDGLTHEEWWAATKFARLKASNGIAAMQSCYGKSFTVTELPSIHRALHEFDRANVGDQILSALGNPDAKGEYRVRQLIEEAISSSEIEGARPTTREAAQQMLREAREPRSHDERMILNTLRAMERLRALHESGERLTVDMLLELHRILGDDALDVEDGAGKFRTKEHDVTVSDVEGNLWHRPPDAAGLEHRVARLLDFAHGDETDDTEFIHPIVRAIVTHFWLGYEHPFRDGNGRIARALYYWCMLRHGYEVAEFLSISGPIDRSPKKYYLAFAYAETDGNDLTYFVLHQLDVMQEALGELLEHLKARVERLRELSRAIAAFDALNHRQRSLLEYAVRHPAQGATIEGHARSHSVHYMTARSDLADLEQRGLLTSTPTKPKRYFPSQGLLAQQARGGRT